MALVQLLAVIAVISVSYVCSAPVASTTPASLPTRQDINSYLKRFGYIDSNKKDTEIDDFTYVDAVRTLRNFAGLKKGDVDADFAKLMKTPRCGLRDFDTAPSTTGRKRRYVLSNNGTSFWPTTLSNLNFSIGSTAAVRLSFDTLKTRLQQAFQRWTAMVPPSRLSINYANITTAKIKITWGNYSHGDGTPFDGPLNVIAHTYVPTAGLIHFDSAELWTDGPNDTMQSNPYAIHFFQVALHEIGHSLGISHSSVSTAVMYPYYSYKPAIQLTTDDIQAVQALYGVNPCLSNPCTSGMTCVPTTGTSYTCV
jgi:hypothetical protein